MFGWTLAPVLVPDRQTKKHTHHLAWKPLALLQDLPIYDSPVNPYVGTQCCIISSFPSLCNPPAVQIWVLTLKEKCDFILLLI